MTKQSIKVTLNVRRGGKGGRGAYTYMQQVMDASKVSSAYKNNAPVQQNAYLVNIWQRTS